MTPFTWRPSLSPAVALAPLPGFSPDARWGWKDQPLGAGFTVYVGVVNLGVNGKAVAFQSLDYLAYPARAAPVQ
jgi:hypothetical protein